MDKNKQLKLREIGYRVNESCGTCVHASFPNDDWGTCGIHTYEHQKHNAEVSQLSINKFGSCPKYEAHPVATAKLHAFDEFVVRYLRLQDFMNSVYDGAAKECEECEARLAPQSRINGHHMAQRIVTNVEESLKRRKLF